MSKSPKACPHCRGGYVYNRGELLPSYCSSCNGTGIAGNPLLGLALIVAVVFLVAFAIWVGYSVLAFEYD